MGSPAEKRIPATYADYVAVPAHQRAEIIDGTLYVFPRPAPKHATAASRLTGKLSGPFDLGEGGPGGWRILIESEIHFFKEQPVSPDLAGWRLERMPALPETAYFTLAPDWICEVLSPSTEQYDRETKMPLYAAHGVQWAWLVDPLAKKLEVYALGEAGRWGKPSRHGEADRVRAAPFDAIELDLSVLWAK
jgi:Uma2 family endonuclease